MRMLLLCAPLVHVGVATASSAPWNPLEKQEVELDTLFLFDGAQEKLRSAHEQGFISGDAAEAPPSQDLQWDKTAIVPGKFRQGVASLNSSYGYVWLPMVGMMPASEWTIEFWLAAKVPWNEVGDPPQTGQSPLQIGGTIYSDLNLQFIVSVATGGLCANLQNGQTEAGLLKSGVCYNYADPKAPKNHTHQAGEWVSVALTFKNTTLVLYVNGVEVGRNTAVAAPQLWADAASSSGITIGGNTGRGATNFSVSDLRISRSARTPGEVPSVSNANTLTVHKKQTGKEVAQGLLGGLHTLRGNQTEKMAKGALNYLRTDKLITATPICHGVTPNATCPAAGASGAFSYDWQVVDRTFDYFKRLGITPYISLDSTPEILGGTCPPFTGLKLNSSRSYESCFTPEIPNDFAAFGQIVYDLVHHIVKEKGYNVSMFGVWNEPNGNDFWKCGLPGYDNDGCLPDYLRLYDVCAAAVKKVDPTLKIGGPEVAGFSQNDGMLWVETLIAHAANNSVPLDFISWHYYLSTVEQIDQVRANVDNWSRRYGLATPPPLIIGEWCWAINNFPGTGYRPFREMNYFLNDWHATFTASSLIAMQRNDVIVSVYTNPVAENGSAGFDSTGLMSATHPWANLNAFRLWSKLQPTVLVSNYTGQPGVFALASTGASGTLVRLTSTFSLATHSLIQI